VEAKNNRAGELFLPVRVGESSHPAFLPLRSGEIFLCWADYP